MRDLYAGSSPAFRSQTKAPSFLELFEKPRKTGSFCVREKSNLSSQKSNLIIIFYKFFTSQKCSPFAHVSLPTIPSEAMPCSD